MGGAWPPVQSRCLHLSTTAGSIEALIARKLLHTLQRREALSRCTVSDAHDLLPDDLPSGSEEGNAAAEELAELDQKVELVSVDGWMQAGGTDGDVSIPQSIYTSMVEMMNQM